MKRIVICADGTWNQRDQVDNARGKRKPTNVTKLARAVLPRAADSVDQVVCYDEGVGTAGGLFDQLTGGAFGSGMEPNIRELYRFIVYNYVPGDELYFFGFSRGAFTVRSLAGFMNKLGLVTKNDDYYVPELYACYEKSGGPGLPEWDKILEKVKQDQRLWPPIKFIGVWDTVGALGLPGKLGKLLASEKYKYHDVELRNNVQNAVHAMAIDERRRPFDAILWRKPPDWSGELLVQAWFAGVHSNVGGGYDRDGLANEALHWVVEHAERLGLAVNPDYLSFYKPFFNVPMQDSMSVMYRLMGPLDRPIGQFADHGEAIHQSAMDRLARAECDYKPPNLVTSVGNGAATKLPIVNTTRIARGRPFIPAPAGTP